MKKQTKLSIRAHLLWSALILLALVAICAIPFALAQRNGTKRTVAKPDSAAANISGTDLSRIPKFPYSSVRTRRAEAKPVGQSHLPTASSRATGLRRLPILAQPKAPQVVLYDQYDNLGANATADETFSDFTGFDSDLADDFVVPGGQTWTVQSIDADGTYFNGLGPANSFNVFVYTDCGGLPGTQVYSTLNQTWTQVGTTFTVNLSPAAVLGPGTYWIEIQANMTFSVGGQWGWTDRTVLSNNPAAWQNPGGGFGTPCTTWGQRGSSCGIDPGVPDQVYRINGTIGGTATPTPPCGVGTPTPTPTPTPTGTPVPGCGLLVGSGLTLGYGPNNYTLIASNTVNYTFANSPAAPNDYAVFQTHNPWGFTVLTDAITANGHTFTTFTPAQLAGFPFNTYRVVVLNCLC
jgi:hypothetical protein